MSKDQKDRATVKPKLRFGEQSQLLNQSQSLQLQSQRSLVAESLTGLAKLFMEMAPSRRASKRFDRHNSKKFSRSPTEASFVEKKARSSFTSENSKDTLSLGDNYNTDDTNSDAASQNQYVTKGEMKKLKDMIQSNRQSRGKSVGHIKDQMTPSRSSRFGFFSRRQRGDQSRGTLVQQDVKENLNSRSFIFGGFSKPTTQKKFNPRTATLRERPQRGMGSFSSFIGEVPLKLLQAFTGNKTDDEAKKKFRVNGNVGKSGFESSSLKEMDIPSELTLSKFFRNNNDKARTITEFTEAPLLGDGDENIKVVALGDADIFADDNQDHESFVTDESGEDLSLSDDEDDAQLEDSNAKLSEKHSILTRKLLPSVNDERFPTKVSDTTGSERLTNNHPLLKRETFTEGNQFKTLGLTYDDDEILHFADEHDLMFDDANDFVNAVSTNLVGATEEYMDEEEDSGIIDPDELFDGVMEEESAMPMDLAAYIDELNGSKTVGGMTKFMDEDLSDLDYVKTRTTAKSSEYVKPGDTSLFDDDDLTLEDESKQQVNQKTIFGPDIPLTSQRSAATVKSQPGEGTKQKIFRIVKQGRKKKMDFQTKPPPKKTAPPPRKTTAPKNRTVDFAPKVTKFKRAEMDYDDEEEDDKMMVAKSSKKVRFPSELPKRTKGEEEDALAQGEVEDELQDLMLTVESRSNAEQSKTQQALNFLKQVATLKNNPGQLYKVERVLGKGAFGEVRKCRDKETNQLVAVKVCTFKKEDSVLGLATEIKVMQRTKECPYLIRYFSSVRTHQLKIWISMELCEAGDVSSLMDICQVTLSVDEILPIVAAVALGLEFLHKKNIIHRDVKCANIMLSRNGLPKLGDFGVSRQVEDDELRSMTFAGSPYWMAPEMIKGKHIYNKAVDLWSLGITICEMFAGSPPLFDLEPMEACKRIIRPEHADEVGLNTSKKDKKNVVTLSWLVDELLEPEIDERATIEKVVNHNLLKTHIKALKDMEKLKYFDGELSMEAAVQFGGKKRKGGAAFRSMQSLAPLKKLVDDNIGRIEEYHLSKKKKREWQNNRKKHI